MDISIYVDACHAVVNFDSAQAALAFMRMIAGNLAPDQFVAAMHALVDNPHAADMAKDIVHECMGQGA